MSPKPAEKREYEQLDELTGRTSRKLFAMSPNDALVQIALPVVLILAIATRLMTIGQGAASQAGAPSVLELWKQQLIVRIDRVLNDWEKESALHEFSDFKRVYWAERWPEDNRFRLLCRQGSALADIGTMKQALYRKALRYRPSSDAEGASSPVWAAELYDPLAGEAPGATNAVPPELVIDAERRQYALQVIDERCRQWKEKVENLQWSLIDRLVADLSPEDRLTDGKLAVQMQKIATALDARGYPLLPGVINEYRKEP
ncbi:MAG: hypothetical protein WCK89_04700 [bacterium]